MTATPTIGVLALQGDVREHVAVLGRPARSRPRPPPVRAGGLDGLVLPGGESTTIGRLARTSELLEPLRERIAAGMPAYGSCAGMILLSAGDVVDGQAGQETFGGLDITVRRNAFGRQVDSFEGPVELAGVGTRARRVHPRAVGRAGRPGRRGARRVGADEPAAGRIVAVRQGDLLATSFHPELTGDARVHELFVALVHQHA